MLFLLLGDVKVSKGGIYYRSNLKTPIKELKSLRYEDAHVREINRTPFWLLFNAIYKTADTEKLKRRCGKFEDNIKKIILCFDDSLERFVIGGEVIKLSNRDVHLIFGVSGGSTPMPLKVSEYEVPNWIKRCFGREIDNSEGPSVLSKTLIYGKLKEMLSRQDRDTVMDVARLTHCYLMAALLAPNQNSSMAPQLTGYLENFEDVCDYDWCTFIVDMLKSQIMSSKSLKAGGCTMILPVST